ncbi:MAG TPA: ABC-2 family transporter protein [Vicinamibacterales bacterium]|nr:ABC-2 family transporter protein [Vicinamibacterales bacterium]
MTAQTIARYAAFSRIAVAQARRERGEIYGRVVFFAVILGVFSSLWRAIGEAGMPLGADRRALVWYLAMTEWILLSAPPIHLEVQEAIRRGDVVYELGRPASYVVAQFASCLGLVAARAPLLGATAGVCAFALTRWVPPLAALAVAIPFGLAATAVMAALHLAIGLLAFWLEDVSPVFWVSQKLMFVLGGLMLPLQLYPLFIQRLAAFTPFPVLLGGPASLVLGPGGAGVAELARGLALWSAVIAIAVRWLFRRATATMTINGG